MENFKFDHSLDTIPECIGISEEEYLAVPEKLRNTAKKFYKVDDSRRSKLVEEVLNNYSYNELVLIAATHVDVIIQDAKKEIQAFK